MEQPTLKQSKTTTTTKYLRENGATNLGDVLVALIWWS